MIFLDIDHFKIINDLWGHKIGDVVLQKITKSILQNIGNDNRLYRWGGEEFIIILPQENLASTEIVAEKIRNIIQSEDFGIDKEITISLGACEYKEDENADAIISRLDKALYKAKIQGRNRVVIDD